MTFAGFDLDRTDALARALRNACDQAPDLSRAIAATLDEAHEIIMTADGAPLPRGGTWSTDYDAQRVGLTTVTRDASLRAGQIERRAAHLRACEKLDRDGFWVDLAHVFDDAPPPDEESIRRVLGELRSASGDDTGWNGNHDDLTEALEHLQGLKDDELDAVLLGLTDDEYAKLDAAMRRGDGFFSDNGLSNDELLQLGTDILPRASAAAVRRLSSGLPVLEPTFGNLETPVEGDYSWGGSISLDGASLDDINQGAVGDCWFLAGLGAELRADPSFVADHVTDNGNGTWTVTLYRDGKPVPVTVDGSVPGGSSPRFAHGPGGAPNWVSIYEKAFARFHGSYGDIEGGWGDQSMEAITGRDADRHTDGMFSDLPSLDEVKKQLDAGHPVTVGTKDDASVWPWGADDDDDRVFDKQLVSHHEYIVVKVEDTDDGERITVRNPWGNTDQAPEQVVLDEDEYRRWFSEVSVG
ncbi:C2 family cysteine protease [Cellulomonas sp. HZM]|uniref:C2 family cysteine protease n=1 Tax=Cellulomonas sp. HZM TaxID=1454010 RepID=UPI00049335E3|nr:C2 family cysteine protease [Cellulomonas sp. HZM]